MTPIEQFHHDADDTAASGPSARTMPRVEFYEGMRLRTEESGTWTVTGVCGPKLELDTDIGRTSWHRHDMLGCIASGEITVEPAVGMTYEEPGSLWRRRITEVRGRDIIAKGHGEVAAEVGYVMSIADWHDGVRHGRIAILAPEQPAPRLPPDVDPEATWDGSDDCDDTQAQIASLTRRAERAERFAALWKCAAKQRHVKHEADIRDYNNLVASHNELVAEVDGLRSELDDERFRSRDLQERLEAAEKRAQEAESERDAAQNLAASFSRHLELADKEIDRLARVNERDLSLLKTLRGDRLEKAEAERDAARARIAELEAKLQDGDCLSGVALTTIAAEIMRRANHAGSRTDGHADPVRAHILHGVVLDLAFVAGIPASRITGRA